MGTLGIIYKYITIKSKFTHTDLLPLRQLFLPSIAGTLFFLSMSIFSRRYLFVKYLTYIVKNVLSG